MENAMENATLRALASELVFEYGGGVSIERGDLTPVHNDDDKFIITIKVERVPRDTTLEARVSESRR